MNTEKGLAIVLRKFRKHTGSTLVLVSKNTGLSVSFLSDLERGKVEPSMATLRKLGTFYGMPVSKIIKSAEMQTEMDAEWVAEWEEAI